jgi:predicted DNA-binding transcriptional regulator YafY
LRRRVAALGSFIVPLTGAGPTVDAETLTRIAGACRDYEEIRFRYQSRDGTASEREVEPHRLVHTGRRWYLAAWDGTRNNWRTFRVDRIEPGLSTGARFAPRKPPEGDFAAYVSKSVAYAPYPHRAKIVLHVPVEEASKKVPPAAGTLEAIDGRSCLLHMGAGSLDMLAIYLAMIGFDFEVREPVELVDHIRSLAERLARAGSA